MGLRARKAASTVCVVDPFANRPPIPGFGWQPGAASHSIEFMDQSADADGRIVAYAWSFGDGGTSPQPSPRHTYPAAGSYQVTLTVTTAQAPPPPPPPDPPPA